MKFRRSVKTVLFSKSGKAGQSARPIVITNIPRHIRILNAPRAVIHIKEEDCVPVKFGF